MVIHYIMKKENFIIIYRHSFDPTKEGKLYPFDLFVYALIYRCRLPFGEEWFTFTNLFLIYSMITCSVDGSRTNDKLKNIRNSLISLMKKGYISVDLSSETSFDEMLKIKINPIDKDDPDFVGYLEVPYSLYDQFNNKEKFYLYVLIDLTYYSEQNSHFNNKFSHKYLASLMNVSDRTVKSIVKEMNSPTSNPRIYKFSGDFKGTKRQDENTYYTRPDESLLLKWKNFYDDEGAAKSKSSSSKKKLKGTDTVISSILGEVTVDEYIEYTELSNWGKSNDAPFSFTGSPFAELEYEDYECYKVCEDNGINKKFVIKCENIMKAIKNKDTYDGMFEEFEILYGHYILGHEETDEIQAIKEKYEEKRKQEREKMDFLMGRYDDSDPF